MGVRSFQEIVYLRILNRSFMKISCEQNGFHDQREVV